MTKLKCLKYLYLRIGNIEDVKVIDLICIESKLICQFKSNEHCNKTENQNNVALKEQTKQRRTKTAKSHENTEKKNKYV